MVAGEVIGMGGLRRLRAGVGEAKRIYVRPTRGLGLDERILARLLADAVTFGYSTLLLDSGPFMQSAHRLLNRPGFAGHSVS